ncbi:MAG: sulfite exporter TauE/SafE family protein [Aquabacterium sp.]|nr:sulfite exporter TauE/SafE family protein [Aquabacterium sp.]
MLSGLILTAFLMGAGGAPHCAAMCGAPCAAALPQGIPVVSLLGRCVGYALLGSIAAASSGMAAQWGRQIAFIQPFWILLQAGALVFGLLLLFRGQMPGQLDAAGQEVYRSMRARMASSAWASKPFFRPFLPFMAGMAWAMLPCGLLYGAVVVAALAPSALGGALVMLAFAVPSAVGVWAAPAVLRRLMPNQMTGRWVDPKWAIRLSGLMLSLMTAWALYHQLTAQWQAWCAP